MLQGLQNSVAGLALRNATATILTKSTISVAPSQLTSVRSARPSGEQPGSQTDGALRKATATVRTTSVTSTLTPSQFGSPWQMQSQIVMPQAA